MHMYMYIYIYVYIYRALEEGGNVAKGGEGGENMSENGRYK